VRPGQLEAGERVARGDLDGLSQLRLRRGRLSEGEQARAQENAGGGVGAVESYGLAELGRGLRVLPALLVDDAEVVVDVRARRLRRRGRGRGGDENEDRERADTGEHWLIIAGAGP